MLSEITYFDNFYSFVDNNQYVGRYKLSSVNKIVNKYFTAFEYTKLYFINIKIF
jgi:hypothetical protein